MPRLMTVAARLGALHKQRPGRVAFLNKQIFPHLSQISLYLHERIYYCMRQLGSIPRSSNLRSWPVNRARPCSPRYQASEREHIYGRPRNPVETDHRRAEYPRRGPGWTGRSFSSVFRRRAHIADPFPGIERRIGRRSLAAWHPRGQHLIRSDRQPGARRRSRLSRLDSPRVCRFWIGFTRALLAGRSGTRTVTGSGSGCARDKRKRGSASRVGKRSSNPGRRNPLRRS